MPSSSLPSELSDDNLGNGKLLGGSIPLNIHLGFLGLMFALLGGIFWPSLVRLWLKTNPLGASADPNWSHAFLVPIIGLYYLYINREELAKKTIQAQIPIRYSKRQLLSAAIVGLGGLAIWGISKGLDGAVFGEFIGMGLGILGVLALALNWGLGFTLWGLMVYALSIYPIQNDYLKDIGLVATIFGVVLTLYGWDIMRIAWFPILFLFCAIPWSGLMYSWLAGPLQVLAARVASGVLHLTGVSATVSGTNISMMGKDGHISSLNVEEACSGLKSLMTFMTIGGALAFLSNRPLWQRLTITFSAIPIAIACNTMRVAVQGLLDYYVSHELSQNFAHQFVGLIMLVPAFFLLLAVGWVLDHVFIEEVDEKDMVGKMTGAPNLGVVGAGAASLRAAPRTAPQAAPAKPASQVATSTQKPATPTAASTTPKATSVAPATSAQVQAPAAQAAPRTSNPAATPAPRTTTPPTQGQTPAAPSAPRAVTPAPAKAPSAIPAPPPRRSVAAVPPARPATAPAKPATPPASGSVPDSTGSARPTGASTDGPKPPAAPAAGTSIPVPPSRRSQVAQNRKPPQPGSQP